MHSHHHTTFCTLPCPRRHSMDIGFIGMGGGGTNKATTPSPWQLINAPPPKQHQANPKAGTPKPADSTSSSSGGSSGSSINAGGAGKPAPGTERLIKDTIKNGKVVTGTPPHSSSSKDSRQGTKGPSKPQQQQQRKQEVKGAVPPQPKPVSGGVGRDGGRRWVSMLNGVTFACTAVFLCIHSVDLQILCQLDSQICPCSSLTPSVLTKRYSSRHPARMHLPKPHSCCSHTKAVRPGTEVSTGPCM